MIISLKAQKESLISYMKSKIDAEDWHAIQDAASDIREIEAKLEVYDLAFKQEAEMTARMSLGEVKR